MGYNLSLHFSSKLIFTTSFCDTFVILRGLFCNVLDITLNNHPIAVPIPLVCRIHFHKTY